MKKLGLVLLLIAGLFCFSCSSSDDGDTQSSVNSEIEGAWEGTFSGTDKGTWSMVVDASGKITGTAVSNQFGSLAISGAVVGNGSLTATAGGASSGSTFEGTFKDGKGNGKWVNVSQSLNGSWTGAKK